MEEEEESIPQFESEFDDDQGDEADGWIPSTDAEIEEQVSLSCAEDGGPFSIKIEVPGHVDSDNEESAGHSESEEETENEQDQCEEESGCRHSERTNSDAAQSAQSEPSSCFTDYQHLNKGRPRFVIHKNFLTVQQSNQISWQASAKLLGVSRATVYRRRRDFGMLTPIGNCYSNMSDDELDGIVRQILQTSPAAGERVLQNTLISRGLRIQRSRLRASVQRVDPKVEERRKCQPKKKIVKSKDACCVIHKNFLTVQQSNQISWQATAKLLGVSRATVYRRRRDFGMLTPIGNRYSNMNDDELDGIVRQILQTSPAAGQRVIQNTLISRGLRIQRSRLRASVQRVDPKVKERRKCQLKKKIVKSKDA